MANTTPQIVITQKPKTVNVRSVWGKVLLYMRKNNLLGLHSICVDVADVKILNEDFIITIHKSINYDTLKKEQNYNDLVDTFKKLGYNYNVKLTFEPNSADKQQDKAQVLSQILGCKVELKVKGEI